MQKSQYKNDTKSNKQMNDFIEKNLFLSICQYLNINEGSISKNLEKSFRRMLIVEKNTIFIPLNDLVDAINFSIFVESDTKPPETEEPYHKLEKLSSIMASFGERKESTTVSEETYTFENIVNCLNNISEVVGQNSEIKNGHYIITFE